MAILLMPLQVSAAGFRLVYTEYEPDAAVMRVRGIDEDGSNDEELSNGLAVAEGQFGLSWSPDGSKIAYAGSDINGSQINVYVMDADGSNPVALTSNNNSGVYGISWSPDGTKIAYVGNEDGSTFNIFSINTDGSNNTQLSNGDMDLCPQWTPDGETIVFSSIRDGNTEIYTMTASGSAETNITNHAQTDGAIPTLNYAICNFDVSPDGETIVFTTNRDDDAHILYTMTVEGDDVTQLHTGPAGSMSIQPRYSNDGSTIAYGSDVHDAGGGRESFQVYTMAADGSDITQLTSDGANVFITDSLLFGGIDWSPDDGKIAFSTTRAGSDSFEVFTMNADGSNQTLLAPGMTFGAQWQSAVPASEEPTESETADNEENLADTGTNQFILLTVSALLLIAGFIGARLSARHHS